MSTQSSLRTSSGTRFASEISDAPSAPRVGAADARPFDPMGRLCLVREQLRNSVRPRHRRRPVVQGLKLVSLEQARNSHEIKYRGLDIDLARLPLTPPQIQLNGIPIIDIGVPTAGFRNFKLISREEAASRDSVRLHSVMN